MCSVNYKPSNSDSSILKHIAEILIYSPNVSYFWNICCGKPCSLYFTRWKFGGTVLYFLLHLQVVAFFSHPQWHTSWCAIQNLCSTSLHLTEHHRLNLGVYHIFQETATNSKLFPFFFEHYRLDHDIECSSLFGVIPIC